MHCPSCYLTVVVSLLTPNCLSHDSLSPVFPCTRVSTTSLFVQAPSSPSATMLTSKEAKFEFFLTAADLSRLPYDF